MKNFFPFLLFSIMVFASCTSGKKSLQKGNYDRSVYQAINRIKQTPGNKKARQTLMAAWPAAIGYHWDIINNSRKSSDILKWEKMADQYSAMNRLYDALMVCPAGKQVIRNPKKYITELDAVRLKAAEVRYGLGVKALGIKTRESAREGYYHFLRTEELRPGFKDTREKISEAKFHATLKVVVEKIPIHSATLQISNEFFQNQLQTYMNGNLAKEFVQFYTPNEAKKVKLENPDQIVIMRFDDFTVGNHYVKEKVETLTRDSVEIQVKGKDGTTSTGYITVNAELSTFRKAVDSRGLLDFKIIDGYTNKVVMQRKLPGSFTWFCEWGNFNGDGRALNKKQLAITKKREAMPPPPQTLFVEFTKPIFDQIMGSLAEFYRNY